MTKTTEGGRVQSRRYRIFVLGAGFSRAAGLPLGEELWTVVRERSRGRLDSELETYLQYLKECDGIERSPNDVDFEDFLGFLDLDHHLALRGADNWQYDGSDPQILVKRLIAASLVERTPATDSLPQIYYDFASQLAPGDRVLTFNYDVVLERAMEHVGRPYRLFQDRLTEVFATHAYSDPFDNEEVVILKLHGSVDWFNRAGYSVKEEQCREMKLSGPPEDPVFGPDAKVQCHPLLEGPQHSDDSLRSVYRVTTGLNELYASPLSAYAAIPWLLTPSRTKAVYADFFRYFWLNLGLAGFHSLGVVVIGYSLPQHDEYAKQALFRLMHSYQESSWGQELLPGQKKQPVIMVDFATTPEGRDRFRARYAFVDPQKAQFLFNGFNKDAVSLIHGA